MAQVIKNNTATAIGFWSNNRNYVVVRAMGGQNPIDTTPEYREIAALLRVAGAITVTEVSPPINTLPPSVMGNLKVFETILTSDGNWSGSMAQFSYQWYSHTAATGAGTALAGETDRHLQIGEDLEGKYLYCMVTATNEAGSASVSSDRQGPVAPDA